MKIFICFLSLFIQAFSCFVQGQTSIMSFNIRYNNINDNENWWEHRKAEIVKTLNFYSPDLLGVQEGLNDQIRYLDSKLIDYTYVGVGRDDGKLKGEYAAIFYKKKVFKLLSTKTYWLSETPETVSVGWDASMERIVTFAQFKDYRNGNILYVFNTHFDHIGKISRKKSAELILRIIKEEELEKKKIIVMGDLNCNPKELPIEILKTKLDDSYDKSRAQPYGPIGTFNGFDLNNKLNNRIDYIFTKNIDVLRYINIDDRRANNLYLSDHFPVLIRID